MKGKSLLTYSQEPATGSYPVPNELGPSTHACIYFKTDVDIFLPITFFASVFSTKLCYVFLIFLMHSAGVAHIILHDLITIISG